ncbi:hypothetical protein AAFM48_24010 [Burkholderia pseudomallei]
MHFDSTGRQCRFACDKTGDLLTTRIRQGNQTGIFGQGMQTDTWIRKVNMTAATMRSTALATSCAKGCATGPNAVLGWCRTADRIMCCAAGTDSKQANAVSRCMVARDIRTTPCIGARRRSRNLGSVPAA